MTHRARLAEGAIALLAGLLFGAGLVVSGMANPAKVLGFLDLAGHWDPTLAIVMAAAVAIGLAGFGLSARRERSVLGLPMRIPGRGDIDVRLLAGASIFGVGWGLAGLCPGPAVVALATGSGKVLLFVAAMVAGMAIHDLPRRTR